MIERHVVKTFTTTIATGESSVVDNEFPSFADAAKDVVESIRLSMDMGCVVMNNSVGFNIYDPETVVGIYIISVSDTRVKMYSPAEIFLEAYTAPTGGGDA
jgi:hypothetical protein